jgi:hypothetical protein
MRSLTVSPELSPVGLNGVKMRTLVTALLCCADAGASIAATASIRRRRTICRTLFMLNTSFVTQFFAALGCREGSREASGLHGPEIHQYFVQRAPHQRVSKFDGLNALLC